MLPLRLVLDTNVVVSGLLKPRGLERLGLVFALTGPAQLCVSREMMDEYARVLGRPRLKIAPFRAAEVLKLIEDRAVKVTPSRRVYVAPDLDDNLVLECADEGRADYLVTGNQRHFPRFWKSTKIITPRELSEIIAPHLLP